MEDKACITKEPKGLSSFERYLSAWVMLCIAIGIALGKLAPEVAIPLFLQTNLIFWLAYGSARILKLPYQDAAPSALIGASNHFEVAIATSVLLFGLSSGAALATVVGVLIEVPVMLLLVRICLRTQGWFKLEPQVE